MEGWLLVTLSVKAASVDTAQLSVTRIVIVCDPIGPALLIETTPVVLSTAMVPV
jgi:pseudouridine-5'-phosphate glycosidase